VSSLPFWSLSGELRELGLVVAIAIGFGFGFVLERAGFGRAQKLVGQFFGHDLTVFKVMFSAIVVAMLGAVVLGAAGILDYRALADHATSETFLWPMVAGGFVLGMGFIVSGYCPGTSYVAMASGKLDGLATVLGTIVGQLVYAGLEHQAWLARFHSSGRLGHLYLWELLHLPPRAGPAMVAVAVTATAIGCFVGAERLERALAARAPAPASPAGRPGFAVLAGMGGLALAGLAVALVPAGGSASTRAAIPISADDLARRSVEEPWRLRILDLRAVEACAARRVPGAACVPPEKLASLGLADASGALDLVLVADRSLAEVPAAAAAYPGRVLALEGGYGAFARTSVAAALAGVATAPPPSPIPAAAPAGPRKGGGGCGG